MLGMKQVLGTLEVCCLCGRITECALAAWDDGAAWLCLDCELDILEEAFTELRLNRGKGGKKLCR